MFKFLKKKEQPKNLKEILERFEGLEKKFEAVSQELEKIKKESRFMIQKVGIIRYNPFSGVGGDQSFSIALLDKNNNGAIITSLYTREGNRVYGKPLKNGNSEYSLSGEEQQAIKKAIDRI